MKIAQVPVQAVQFVGENVPVTSIIIEKVTLIAPKKKIEKKNEQLDKTMNKEDKPKTKELI